MIIELISIRRYVKRAMRCMVRVLHTFLSWRLCGKMELHTRKSSFPYITPFLSINSSAISARCSVL